MIPKLTKTELSLSERGLARALQAINHRRLSYPSLGVMPLRRHLVFLLVREEAWRHDNAAGDRHPAAIAASSRKRPDSDGRADRTRRFREWTAGGSSKRLAPRLSARRLARSPQLASAGN